MSLRSLNVGRNKVQIKFVSKMITIMQHETRHEVFRSGTSLSHLIVLWSISDVVSCK